MKKGRSVYLFPPGGSRMRAIRVPLWLLIAAIVMAAAGVVGFFVPLDRMMLTDQELAQGNNLRKQNDRLSSNIGFTLKHLSALKERITRIQGTKEQYFDAIGLPDKPKPVKPPQKTPAVALSPAAILRHIGEYEKILAGFALAVGGEKRNLFDTIPVCLPVSPARSVMTRRYGMTMDPFTSKPKMHYGVDVAAVDGTPVLSTAVGVVTQVESDPVWGKRVTITHGRGFRTVYAHLGSVKTVKGKNVARGDEIGTVGSSGLTTGPHLHYELWRNDKQQNPEEYFFPDEIAAGGAQ
jgi:murein DD-endopeptidase MepM/ murein hydrolase activator NlpD